MPLNVNFEQPNVRIRKVQVLMISTFNCFFLCVPTRTCRNLGEMSLCGIGELLYSYRTAVAKFDFKVV